MHQYKLIFKLEQKWLPKETDRVMVSFLKASAQSYSFRFYDSLYDKSKSIIKSYTYSMFLPGARFVGDRIELESDEFSLFFSDADLQEALQFFNGFQKMKFRKYPINGNSMELKSIRFLQLHEIKENEIIVRMQSPLIVRRHNVENNTDIYFTSDMEGFSSGLKENIEFFLGKTGIKANTDGFSIQPVKGKKVVVPVFGRNTDASLGIYKLTGSCGLLNILYLAGAGARRSSGHGKFEVIG